MALLLTIVLVVGSLLIGTVGYMSSCEMDWDAAFHHTCLMLSGHDVNPGKWTTGGYLFSGFFVLYARLVFVSMIAIVSVPILHRVLHKLHLEDENIERSQEDPSAQKDAKH